MKTSIRYAAMAVCLAGFMPSYAFAHAVAGDRIFPATLEIDDPAVSDEASFPTFTWQRQGATDDSNPLTNYGISGEYDKRITPDVGVAFNYGYNIFDVMHQKTQAGVSDLDTTLKYQFYTNAEHEFTASVGVIREWGGTGAVEGGADPIGSTTPTVYWGYGFGDLPDSVAYLKPFAFTGTFGRQFADTNADPDFWNVGLSLQYSLYYLRSQVKDLGLPEFVNNMIPLVEFTYTAPTNANGGNLPIQSTLSPGIIYLTSTYQLGLEALVPVQGQPKANVGMIAQFHIFFDDIFPATIGKPIFEY
jgi:hypothetical protein